MGIRCSGLSSLPQLPQPRRVKISWPGQLAFIPEKNLLNISQIRYFKTKTVVIPAFYLCFSVWEGVGETISWPGQLTVIRTVEIPVFT